MTVFSFKPNAENKKFLENITNKNSFINDLLDLIRSDKIKLELKPTQNKTEIEVKESKEELEKKKLELTHLDSKIRLTNQRVIESAAKARFLNLQSDFLENQGKPLSNSGKRMLSKSIKHDESKDKINCPKCEKNFPFSDYVSLARAKEDIIDHYAEAHKAFFNNDELKQLREISV